MIEPNVHFAGNCGITQPGVFIARDGSGVAILVTANNLLLSSSDAIKLGKIILQVAEEASKFKPPNSDSKSLT